MKNKNIRLLSLLILGFLALSSCKKESDNIFNMFEDVNVIYTSALSNEVLLDFEISTPTSSPVTNQMVSINIAEAGSTTPIVTIPTATTERNKFVATIKLKSDKPESVTYEVWATNSSGNRISTSTVVYHGNPVINPNLVSDFTNVNDGETVYIDYTITSDKVNMHSVVVERVGGANSGSPERTPTVIPNESEKRSYSRVLKLLMQRNGKTTYRIYALDDKGIYMGDGYKKVTIEVNPSYVVLSQRRIYAPDTITKVNPSFFSLSRAAAVSYTDGQANSADIDFGIWRTPDLNPNDRGRYVYNYYPISVATNPFPTYDISTWTKRATVLSAPVTNGTNTFLYDLVSSSLIETRAKTVTMNANARTYTAWRSGLAPGNIVYFLTPEGKYGVFLVTGVSEDYNKKPYVNITIKMQK